MNLKTLILLISIIVVGCATFSLYRGKPEIWGYSNIGLNRVEFRLSDYPNGPKASHTPLEYLGTMYARPLMGHYVSARLASCKAPMGSLVLCFAEADKKKMYQPLLLHSNQKEVLARLRNFDAEKEGKELYIIGVFLTIQPITGFGVLNLEDPRFDDGMKEEKKEIPSRPNTWS